jgi:hypothetical protein
LQGDIGHDLTTINLLLGKHKTLETEILGHESTLQVTKDTVLIVIHSTFTGGGRGKARWETTLDEHS